MAVVADYTVVQSSPITIGDRRRVWEKEFDSGERYERNHAVLMLNLKGLVLTHQSVVVSINGKSIGRIYPYPDAQNQHNYWYSQQITFDAAILKSRGMNVLQIEAVAYEGASSSDHYDDFTIKDVVCLFRQRN